MRIIAGQLRSRRIATPAGLQTRPTSDRVREALFSILEARDVVHEASVLDAYAGSGALALEALSRGAKHATFVDKSRSAVRVLERNINDLGVSDRTSLICGEVDRVLSRTEVPGAPFSLLFLDPPYTMDFDHTHDLLKNTLADATVLAQGAVVVWEHRGSKDTAPIWPESFLAEEPRLYGDTAISIATFRSSGERT